MLNRIALILQTQNLTVSQFADRIGVQRSALSHVLSGRNNPSLDFVTKILRTFPEIRSAWLLFGEGKMYDSLSDVARGGSPDVRPVETVVLSEAETSAGGAASGVMAGPAGSVQTEKTEGTPSVVETMRPNPGEDEDASVGGAAVSDMAAVGVEAAGNAEPAVDRGAETDGPMVLPADFAPVRTDNPRLVKVVFFYSDGHFEEYARR